MSPSIFIGTYALCLAVIYGNYSSRNSPLKQYAQDNQGAFITFTLIGPAIIASIAALLG